MKLSQQLILITDADNSKYWRGYLQTTRKNFTSAITRTVYDAKDDIESGDAGGEINTPGGKAPVYKFKGNDYWEIG